MYETVCNVKFSRLSLLREKDQSFAGYFCPVRLLYANGILDIAIVFLSSQLFR
ncbi:MAG: hypothetical protein OEZ36_03115 [Spirochaetota bacterium]|nr:hypothetical protein [Spirochaetota bacterium]